MATRTLFGFAIFTAVGAGLLSVFLCVWYLSLHLSSVDALWQLPVLLCYPLWLLAALAVVCVYFSRPSLVRRMLMLSCAESLVAGVIWIAVRNWIVRQ